MLSKWRSGVIGIGFLVATGQSLALEPPAATAQVGDVAVVNFYSLMHPPELSATINKNLQKLRADGWSIDSVDVDQVSGGDALVTIVVRK